MVNKFIDSGDRIVKEVTHIENNEKIDKQRTQYLNYGEEDQMEIQGFVRNNLKERCVMFLYFLTFGLLRLFFHWYPHFHLLATHSRCRFEKAETVLVIDNYNGKRTSYFVKKVKELKSTQSEDKNSNNYIRFRLQDGKMRELAQIRIINIKKLTYVWDQDRSKFTKLAGLDRDISRSELHQFNGLSQGEQHNKRIIYGNNEISVPVQTVTTLILLEALTPFYMFQLFSLIVWMAEAYYYYLIAIAAMSVFGIATSVVQTRKNQMNLKGTIHSSDIATVCRGDGTYEVIPATDLVPGDVIVIPAHGIEMQCDAVLLSGSCIVNESMLTGESVPVTKTPLPNNSAQFSIKEDVNHTLFCGTKVMQIRCQETEEVRAVVVRTGYLTTKGELVRSILYPPPADFKFDQDSYKFIAILCFIAALGFIYTVVSKVSRKRDPLDILIKALDLITIVVPPALPAAMTVGKLYALNRLKKCKIFCINSRVINVSGSVNCVCFDKTGTLTEDEMDVWAVVPTNESEMGQPIKDIKHLGNQSLLLRVMATCHSLTYIESKLDGEPLDLKMFKSTSWVFEDKHSVVNYNKPYPVVVKPGYSTSKNTSIEIGIVKQFQFMSSLQRMSVITKSSDVENYQVFCKGSPEIIISLSTSNSVPKDTFRKLREYTEVGYRVIALAVKNLDNSLTYQQVQQLHREDVECDLQFLGLLILENRLKPQTTPVIKTLKEATLKIVMITGDNIQTAVTVARDCTIIGCEDEVIEIVVNKPTKYNFASIEYHALEKSRVQKFEETISNGRNVDIEGAAKRNICFVLSGTTWANLLRYFPDLVDKIVTRGVVFARMSGAQKQQLVEQLKSLGYYVAMCGDGANDCGALKAAHVGISLSEAESSVASPFTSRNPNISCAPEVIKEGRAALVTSFGVFKMMLCYSLTEFASVIILYNIDTNLSSIQYLFIDVCLVLVFSSTFGITKAYDKLAKQPPMMSLLGLVPITSLVMFMAITVTFQVISFYAVQSFEWFEPLLFNPNLLYSVSHENFAVFTVSVFQYIIMAVVFSKGKPYRKAIYTNTIFTSSLVIMTLVCAYITLYPSTFVATLLELKVPPQYDFRLTVLGLAVLNFLVCVFVEDVIIELILAKYVVPRFRKFCKSSRRYLNVLEEIEGGAWPRVDKSDSVCLKTVFEGKYINNGFEYDNESFAKA